MTPQPPMDRVPGLILDPDSLTLDIAALSQQAQLKRYGYRAGGLGLLVPPDTLSEVLRQFVIYPLPNTRGWFRGLVNLRGNIVPVFDLAGLLGVEAAAEGEENLLILDRGAESVGLLINQLPLACEPESWQPAPATAAIVPPALQGHVSECYLHDDMLWLGFDHRAFFRTVKNSIGI